VKGSKGKKGSAQEGARNVERDVGESKKNKKGAWEMRGKYVQQRGCTLRSTLQRRKSKRVGGANRRKMYGQRKNRKGKPEMRKGMYRYHFRKKIIDKGNHKRGQRGKNWQKE